MGYHVPNQRTKKKSTYTFCKFIAHELRQQVNILSNYRMLWVERVQILSMQIPSPFADCYCNSPPWTVFSLHFPPKTTSGEKLRGMVRRARRRVQCLSSSGMVVMGEENCTFTTTQYKFVYPQPYPSLPSPPWKRPYHNDFTSRPGSGNSTLIVVTQSQRPDFSQRAFDANIIYITFVKSMWYLATGFKIKFWLTIP